MEQIRAVARWRHGLLSLRGALFLSVLAVASTAPAVGQAAPPAEDQAAMVDRLREMARQGPLPRELALKLAEVELAAGNPEAAAAQLADAGERFDSVRALMRLAEIRARGGDPRAALEVLGRALALAPNSEEALAAYARLSLAARAPVGAVHTLEPLVRMHPTVAEYPYLLGVARMQVGDMARAVEVLEAAVELAPGRALPRVALGLGLNNLKRYEEARQALAEGLRLEPGSLEAIAALAEAEEGLGQLEEAERHARRVLEQDADHANANLVAGMVLMKRERYEEARDALLAAVASDPDLAKAHYQLSLAYTRLGDRESSRHHLDLYRRALEEREALLTELRGLVGAQRGGM